MKWLKECGKDYEMGKENKIKKGIKKGIGKTMK